MKAVVPIVTGQRNPFLVLIGVHKLTEDFKETTSPVTRVVPSFYWSFLTADLCVRPSWVLDRNQLGLGLLCVVAPASSSLVTYLEISEF